MGIARRSLAFASRCAGLLGCAALFGVMGFGALYMVGASALWAQTEPPIPKSPQDLLLAVVRNENAAAVKAERYEYFSSERSGRTGQHLWTERVIETGPGRMRLLIAEDGKPLSAEREQAERARLERIAQHPEEFIKKEQNTRLEEKRARDLMAVLPKDFLFENVQLQNGVWRMGFRPNPDYSPSGIEERVLHAMAGTLVIDQREERMLHMDFHMVHDVPIGFGLADVRTGTNFESDRQLEDGKWHTTHIATQVRAKAIFFKNVDLNVELTRSEFKLLDHAVSVPEAAQMLLQ